MPEEMNNAAFSDSVDALIQARKSRDWLSALPTRPTSEAEAYAIQDTVARRLGLVVAWKVGARTPDSEPFRAPIHADTLFFDTTTLPAADYQVIGMEAEIAYKFAKDLPPRAEPYSREEVLDAVESVHPAFEIVDTRFAGFGSQDWFSHMADQFNHGALVVGPAIADWRSLEPLKERVALVVDGETKADTVAGNSAGEPVRLLVWMANTGAVSLGGLKAGDVVTTGSHVGTVMVPAGSTSVAVYGTMGTYELTVK
ncbi:2-keto-4-pentenoate hydratase [Azospirillum brasilense]|uniref:2-keto-4-pentenoate hydratase n=1 Tax=Azospirillum brasilense TaxID=192 RepID=A0A235HEU6_AZOBR|nr:fumarylacetoacetate hydrolase family protein [Azospirillum brasilense]OYD84318.1 2-keto-4-pentenoate hydratase [Azospirillum brasilense]